MRVVNFDLCPQNGSIASGEIHFSFKPLESSKSSLVEKLKKTQLLLILSTDFNDSKGINECPLMQLTPFGDKIQNQKVLLRCFLKSTVAAC